MKSLLALGLVATLMACTPAPTEVAPTDEVAPTEGAVREPETNVKEK